MKSCTNKNCKNNNPQEDKNFYKNKRLNDGLHTWCKDCCKLSDLIRKSDLEWKNKSKIKKKEYFSKSTVKNRILYNTYGITLEERNEMLFKQNFKCLGCNVVEKETGTLCVDHKHIENFKNLQPSEKRKYIRGLLCSDCNVALGRLKENIQTFKNLISYIQDFN